MSTRSYRQWSDRIDQPRWEEGWIRQWKNAIMPKYQRGDVDAVGGHRISIEFDELFLLVERFDARVLRDGGPLVFEEQAEKGRQWLARHGKRAGLVGPWPSGIGDRLPVPDPLTITHFHFAGTAIVSDTSWRTEFAPIYVAVYPDGTQLRYHATAWQSGATLEFSWKVPIA